MFPKILPGLIGKLEFLSSETEKISEEQIFWEHTELSFCQPTTYP